MLRRLVPALALVALAGQGAFSASSTHAATPVTWHVAPGGATSTPCGNSALAQQPCALPSLAVGEASSGDTVSIAMGTYSDQIVIPGGMNLTLVGGNPFVSALTTIQLTSTPAVGNGSVLTVNPGSTVLVQGLTLTGGTGTVIVPGLTAGGGVYNQGHLTLLDTTTTNNTISAGAALGGGIYSLGTTPGSASVLVQYSFVQNNAANATGGANIAKGGGIYNDFNSTLSVVCSSVDGNSVTGSNSAYGGGIANVTVDTTTVTPVVGATYSTTGNEVINTDITGNSVSGGTAEAGAVFNSGTLLLNDETLSGNTASSTGGGGLSLGGAIFATTTPSGLVLNNVTIAKNQATSTSGAGAAGGGIYTDVAIVPTNVTIADNSASSANFASGGGILDPDQSTFTNTLLARNTTVVGATTTAQNCSDPVSVDNGGNIDDDGTCGFTNTAQHSVSNSQTIGLGQLANNGGDQLTEALSYPSSSAIGIGAASACLALIGPDGVTTDVDERGLPRHAVTRGACDSGAYDTGGNITLPNSVAGAVLLPGIGRLGFAASTDRAFNIGYITLQDGTSTLIVRQPVLVSCPNQCLGTAAVPLPGPVTETLTGTGTGKGIFAGVDHVVVTLTLSRPVLATIPVIVLGSPVVTSVSVSVNSTVIATVSGPFHLPSKVTYLGLNQNIP